MNILRIFLPSVCLLATLLTPRTEASSLEFLERFALNDEREAALADLVPGTDDAFYYRCLHEQLEGNKAEFERTLLEWQKARKGRWNERMREMRRRQALLDFEQSPEATWNYLINEDLHLRFPHRAEAQQAQSGEPSALDPQRYATATLLERAMRSTQPIGEFTDLGLELAARQSLNPDQRRALLARLTRADIPGLVDMILQDLEVKGSRGFGHHAVHRLLTLPQLQTLSERRPALLHSQQFLDQILVRMQADEETDLKADRNAAIGHFQSLWAFLQPLPPVHNSYKAHVLGSLLDLKRGLGQYDPVLFQAYLELPRRAHFLRRDLQREWEQKRVHFVNASVPFPFETAVIPVPEQELIRDYLIQLLKDADSADAYGAWFDKSWLNEVFAECKLLHGKGDPKDWVAYLSPSAFRRIQERIELNFSLENPTSFRPGDAVELNLEVKNVPQLLVKVFELQAFNYYIEHQGPVDQAVDLDGMVATHERTLQLDAPREQRCRHRLAFPEINKRGVYVIEVIGNGVSSRALVHVGKLELLSRPTAFGLAAVVLNETGELVKDARIWLGGTEYLPDENGLLLLPFTSTAGGQFVILRSGEFCSPDSVFQPGEDYSFSAGIYLEPQGIQRMQTAKLVLSPDLRINGIPMDPAVLEEVVVTLRTMDAKGTPVERDVPAVFERDKEWVHEFSVPQELRSLMVTVRASLRKKSDLQKIELSDQHALSVNSGRRGDLLRGLQLCPSAEGWVAELRGVNGEALSGVPIEAHWRHTYFRDQHQTTLRSDDEGKVALGNLSGVSTLRLSAEKAHGAQIHPQERVSRLPATMHLIAGEKLELPYPHPPRPAKLPPASLFQLRDGNPLESLGAQVKVEGGMLTLPPLAPGSYRLTLHASGHDVHLKVSDGEERLGFAIGTLRRLQLGNRQLPGIRHRELAGDTLRLRLAHPNVATRVIAVARRIASFEGGHPGLGGGQPGLTERNVHYPLVQLVSGRNIGDEYRYVLDRRFATRFAGSLLQRPSLILNPWELRETEAERERLRKGEKYRRSAQKLDALAEVVMTEAPASSRAAALLSGIADPFGGAGGSAGSSLGYDALPQGAEILCNLRPDQDGWIELDLSGLMEQCFLDLYVGDRHGMSQYRVLLQDRSYTPRDLRMRQVLKPDAFFSRQKSVRVLQPGEDVTFADRATARHHVLQTVGDVFTLLQTLNGDPRLQEFAFLGDWHQLEEAEKREKLNANACHELHLFLYFKDRAFFDRVLRPYLANKKDKTFVDRWLLGEDFKDLRGLDQILKRNALEQLLWGRRTKRMEEVLAHFREQAELLPPDPVAHHRRIQTALGLSGLDVGGDEIEDADLESEFLADPFAGSFGSAPPSARRDKGGRLGALLFKGKAEGAAMAVESDALGMASPSLAPAEPGTGADDEAFAWDVEERARALHETQQVRHYRPLPKTKEWAEQNYYEIRSADDVPARVSPTAFWLDLAMGSSLSPEVLSADRSLTEVLAALALSDLPFTADALDETREGNRLLLRAQGSCLLVSEEILPAGRSQDERPLLMSQQFYRPDEPYRYEGNEKIEQFVEGEFLRRTVYGGRVTLTNPTASPRRLNVLLQIPGGAVPVRNGFYTDDRSLRLAPYTTERIDFFFYFPEIGSFAQFPPTAAAKESIVGRVDARSFSVLESPSTVDQESWDWISQWATPEETLAFLHSHNLRRLDLERMAWRLRDPGFFDKALSILEQRVLFHEPSFRYAFMHRDVVRARVWLQQHGVRKRVGLALETPLLTVDPLAEKMWEHLEYAPLVNPRSHKLGAERKILNTAFRGQYEMFLKVQLYRSALADPDRLALCYYLALQDRVEDARKHFDRLNRKAFPEQMQADYMAAWLAMRELNVDEAVTYATPYRAHPVKRWRDRFVNLLNTVDEAGGGRNQVVDVEDRQQDLDQLASRAPSLELKIENGQPVLLAHNIETVDVSYYPMDIELLFSRKPFLAQEGGGFSIVRPSLRETVSVAQTGEPQPMNVPVSMKGRNMIIEVDAAGLQDRETYFANRLRLRKIENYGQVEVRDAAEGNPLPKTYVKVYALLHDGREEFWKDGYTDLRGRFDYVSRNDRQPNEIEKLAILVLSESHGAEVVEGVPPKQ